MLSMNFIGPMWTKIKFSQVGFEVLMVASMKMAVFWVVAT
jgi:hypothetical protein